MTPRIVAISVTAAGEDLARRLPYERRHGRVAHHLGELWEQVDGIVLITATGVAVRCIAPLLKDKRSDPPVVCVDDAGRHVVALVGGHHGGNDLAVDVAALLSSVPVLSTSTDLHGLPALDMLPGFRAEGDVAGVAAAWLAGCAPSIEVDPCLGPWSLPAALREVKGGGPTRVTVTDAARSARPHEVLLRPSSLVVGVGASRGARTVGLEQAVGAALDAAGLSPLSVQALATADLKADEPAVVATARSFGVPLLTFPTDALAALDVPNPSRAVASAVGTPSVAEAAALLASGPGAALVSEKSVSRTRDSTVAISRRLRQRGHLAVVGLGPGGAWRRTPEAMAAVRGADVVIGYGPYVDQAGDLLGPAQTVVRSPIGAETTRAREALTLAAAGDRVALVCSGDPGVYAMASLVFELSGLLGQPDVTVVPGVTAALAAAAVLGAPLGHDHASVSLSDLLTPWDAIRERIEAVAKSDFVLSIYNPRSEKRTRQLPEALAILSGHRPPGTPAAVVTDAGRPGEDVVRTTLAELDPATVGMLSLVVVGSSRTRWIGNRMVTPRGYIS